MQQTLTIAIPHTFLKYIHLYPLQDKRIKMSCFQNVKYIAVFQDLLKMKNDGKFSALKPI